MQVEDNRPHNRNIDTDEESAFLTINEIHLSEVELVSYWSYSAGTPTKNDSICQDQRYA